MTRYLMPYPACHNDVLVRLEKVVSGTSVSRNYYCGACDNTWLIQENDPNRMIATPAIQSRPLKARAHRSKPGAK